jgi:uncharacterized protein (DUF924 family)
LAGIAPPYLPKAEKKRCKKNQETSYELSVEALQAHQKKSTTPGIGGGRPVIASNQYYARKHQTVIARFKRFPHHNAIFGRKSSVEKLALLQERGSRF